MNAKSNQDSPFLLLRHPPSPNKMRKILSWVATAQHRIIISYVSVQCPADPREASHKWTRTRKPNTKWQAQWCTSQKHMICESSPQRFFWRRGFLSGQVKVTPGEWILRVTCPNGECCQNFISNTDVRYNLTSPLEWHLVSYMIAHSQKKDKLTS